MDWKNRIDQIKNKIKLQLHARGVDNLLQLQPIFTVSSQLVQRIATKLEFRSLTRTDLELSTS